MKKLLVFCFVTFCSFTSGIGTKNGNLPDDKNAPSLLSGNSESPFANRLVDSVYEQLHLNSSGLKKEAFYSAYKGYQYLLSKGMLKKTNLLSICDYSQSSYNKRLYVIDLVKQKVLFNTYVSHGKNCGGEYATSFSNLDNSNKSSLGFLITAETYNGKDGFSMHFDGIEPGINDNVRERNIVMHGSWYVNAQRADEGTMMGRSLGCPALSYGEHKQIIDVIKGGSCFFVYADNNLYTHTSYILNAHFEWPVLNSSLAYLPASSGNTINASSLQSALN